MQYDVTIIDVGDADAIVINYEDGNGWKTVVVDAGNIGDGFKVKKYIKHREGVFYVIDYAYCTHPDKDHKGGFFDLISDRFVRIGALVIRRPDDALRNDPRSSRIILSSAHDAYNHPTDERRNLIDEAEAKGVLYEPVLGVDLVDIPLKVIGPRPQFFVDACYEMAVTFAELEDDVISETYAEDELPSDEDAQSVMDEEKETSPTNKSSMILLFHPNNRNFLLAGDACSATIHDAFNDYPQELSGCTLKVPHHGSKHNMTTEVINLLSPTNAVISCKGTKKHPNPAVVHFLSKHCNVYSTHKSGTLVYQSAPVINPATALREKQK